MFLLIWGAVLTSLASIVAPLAAYLVTLTCGITDYEIQLRKEILDLKKVKVLEFGWLIFALMKLRALSKERNNPKKIQKQTMESIFLHDLMCKVPAVFSFKT